VVGVPGATRDTARAQLGLAADDIAIGFVGRLSYQKAPERFVEVITRAIARDSRVKGVILGDGECADAVEEQLARSGHAGRFIWLRRSRAQDVMPAFDAIMMTSRYEGLSYVLLESLASGVPIVTTAVAGAQDVIGSSACGVIARNDEGVVDALFEALMPLVEVDSLRGTMAAAARRRSAELNGPRMIDETERLYRSLMAGATA
jgi:glycosyltransferase involved in cell wall biosynthesis